MDTVSIKLSQETRRVLRLIAAHTDRTIQEVAEELVKWEWQRVQRREEALAKRQPEQEGQP